MVATTARIALVTNKDRVVTAGPDSGVVTKYGDLARDTGPEPVETLFANPADAQIFANERLNLLKRDARRPLPDISGVETGLGLNITQALPTHTIIDDQKLLNRPMMLANIRAIDFGADITALEHWG